MTQTNRLAVLLLDMVILVFAGAGRYTARCFSKDVEKTGEKIQDATYRHSWRSK